MKKIFESTRILDKAVIEKYCLTEDILMENAAIGLENVLLEYVEKTQKHDINVVIVTGSGDNGADGYTLARRLKGTTTETEKEINVTVYPVLPAKSESCIKQKERAEKIGVQFLNDKSFYTSLDTCAILVDCIFGSGFHGTLDDKIEKLINAMNKSNAYRIACDIPSGILFNADVTVTMGALKSVLFSDAAKDFTGKIITADLGISSSIFESAEHIAFLLEKEDLHLPHREKQNVHKGNFGHSAIIIGEKIGASFISGSSALCFGSGLVTLIKLSDFDNSIFPIDLNQSAFELMYAKEFPENTTAIAAGMGLGKADKSIEATNKLFDFALKHKNIPIVIDADLFYNQNITQLLTKCEKVILTPHPKEFKSLLEICNIRKENNECYEIPEIRENRIALMKEFCAKFPKVVLLLKGANVLIGTNHDGKFELYVNDSGKPCLAKAGSGDVLSGLICALLAQGYDPLQAAINSSLAHSHASEKIQTDFAMTPFNLIEAIKTLS